MDNQDKSYIDVWVVLQIGVNIRGIGGLFDTQQAAEAHARTLADSDFDSYHDYSVFHYRINEPFPIVGDRYKWIDDPAPVFKCSKSNLTGRRQ